MDKTEALRLNKGNFDAFMQLSELFRNDLLCGEKTLRGHCITL